MKDLIDYVGRDKIKKVLAYLKSIPSPKTRYRQAQFMLGIAGVRSYWCARAVMVECAK